MVCGKWKQMKNTVSGLGITPTSYHCSIYHPNGVWPNFGLHNTRIMLSPMLIIYEIMSAVQDYHPHIDHVNHIKASNIELQLISYNCL